RGGPPRGGDRRFLAVRRRTGRPHAVRGPRGMAGAGRPDRRSCYRRRLRAKARPRALPRRPSWRLPEGARIGDDRRAEIAETLRKLRAARGLSGPELARRAGVTQPTVSRIETGAITPRPETLERILDALEAPARVRSQVLNQLHGLLSDLTTWESVMRTGRHRMQERIRRLE